MAKTPILGPAYVAQSPDLANQRCVNLYMESVESKSGTEPGALIGCPGLDLAFTLGTGPIRLIQQFQSLLFVVSGSSVYSLNTALTPTLIGTLGTNSGPVTMINNPNSVGIFDGLGAWSYNGSSFVPVALPYSGAVGVPAYLDGFTLLTQPGTNTLWQSNLNDVTTWNPLNFTIEDGNNQTIVSIITFHDQVVVFKTNSMCFYVNAGLSGFAFQRLSGVYPLIGCAAAYSPVVVSDMLHWLGQTEHGQARVYVANSYEPQVASTYAIDNAISNYPAVSDAIGMGYVQGGHSFYLITFPTGNQTWAYDLKESRNLKVPAWHERASFSNGAFNAYAPQTMCRFGVSIYAGDGTNGNVYALDPNGVTDYGSTRKWLRTWLNSSAQYQTETVHFLDIECETGVMTPSGTNPQMMLRQSFDGGYSWSAQLFASVGAPGVTGQSVRFNRLGSTRRGLNSVRTFELSSTDPFKVSLLGAETQ